MLEHILNFIADINSKKNRLLIAIDGMSGAGKTTLAEQLAERLDANVFHMDDFFLRPEQRTEERSREIGGNVDYERFHNEILIPLLNEESIYYQKYSCKEQKLMEKIMIPKKSVTIIEGAYSLHPYFQNPYDIRIFLSIDETLQIERIRKRNGEMMLERFQSEWIPKENAYIEVFHIQESCDLQFHVDESKFKESLEKI